MVRMVIETRPDPRLCGASDESLLPPLASRGRPGKPAQQEARRRARKSRSTRSPSQAFASRIYWREVTNAELRQTRNAGLREAVSLAAQAASGRRGEGRSAEPQANGAGGSDSQSASDSGGPLLLNALLTRAVDAHVQTKLDERIATEWEVVPEVPELDEYIVL